MYLALTCVALNAILPVSSLLNMDMLGTVAVPLVNLKCLIHSSAWH